MVVHWTDEADVKLFIAVLKIHAVKLNYEALAAAMGPDVTPKAITQHIAKLHAKAAANEENNPLTNTTAEAGPTAKKRSRGVTDGRVKKVTGKKQKRKRGADEECSLGGEHEDDEEVLGEGDGEGGVEGEVVNVKGEEVGA